MNLARIAGIAAALLIVAGVAMNWADIKRYIKMESM
jgi:ABC-type phosphate transport system permease subunit